VGYFECGNKPHGSIKCGKYFTDLERVASEEGLCPMQ
jgi:hypothetical protein